MKADKWLDEMDEAKKQGNSSTLKGTQHMYYRKRKWTAGCDKGGSPKFLASGIWQCILDDKRVPPPECEEFMAEILHFLKPGSTLEQAFDSWLEGADPDLVAELETLRESTGVPSKKFPNNKCMFAETCPGRDTSVDRADRDWR